MVVMNHLLTAMILQVAISRGPKNSSFFRGGTKTPVASEFNSSASTRPTKRVGDLDSERIPENERDWDSYLDVPLEVRKWLGSVGYNPNIPYL